MSSWLLSPVSERTQQLFIILDELCLKNDQTPSRLTRTCYSLEEDSLKLFWEQVKLVEMNDDESLELFVRGNKVRAQPLLYSTVRIYTLSTFLLAVYKNVIKTKKECFACGESSSSLDGSLKTCSRCHCAQYCSQDCQVKHFPTHKKECKIRNFLNGIIVMALRRISHLYTCVSTHLCFQNLKRNV